MISPLARPATPSIKTRRRRAVDKQIVPLDAREGPLLGVCVHTTGLQAVATARRLNVGVLEYVVEYYLKPDSFFPTYVCGYRGIGSMELVAICDETRVALHVGLSAEQVDAYRSGVWRQRIDPRYWDRAWRARYSTPLHLYRGTGPNRAFIGLELPPLLEPRDNGLRYTDEQHEAVAELAADVMARHGLKPEARVVVGHEDLNPLTRWNGGGGWDPGARRARPWFDWTTVHKRLGITPPTSGGRDLIG